MIYIILLNHNLAVIRFLNTIFFLENIVYYLKIKLKKFHKRIHFIWGRKSYNVYILMFQNYIQFVFLISFKKPFL